MRQKISAKRQRGVSLVAAIFLTTAMALLGALLIRLLIVGSQETLQEWYSSQALYAAETGVNWARRRFRQSCSPVACSTAAQIAIAENNAKATDQVVIANRAWFTVTTVANNVDGKMMLVITSTGRTGFSTGNIIASRELVVTALQ